MSQYTLDDLRDELPYVQEGIRKYKAGRPWWDRATSGMEGYYNHDKTSPLWWAKVAEYWADKVTGETVTRLFFATHWYRIQQLIRPNEEIWTEDLQEMGILPTKGKLMPLVDLAAFPLEQLRAGKLDLSKLAELGMDKITIMEDRTPLIGLNLKDLQREAPFPLARHSVGNAALEQWTMQDYKHLVERARDAGIDVYQGFWANAHAVEKNPFLWNNPQLRPVVLGSDDVNPLSMVHDGEDEMHFVEYVARQYKRLVKAFGIKGLFLGDGFMGYRSFIRPQAPDDFSFAQKGWEMFYALLSESVREEDGKLLAYDVMGRDMAAARRSGVDYQAIVPHLDQLVMQLYGANAWGKFMNQKGYNLDSDVAAAQDVVQSMKPELRNRIWTTLGTGDTVEGWHGDKPGLQEQHNRTKHLVGGEVQVWANDSIRALLTGKRHVNIDNKKLFRITPLDH